MLRSEFRESTTKWTEWASSHDSSGYDIALFKIYIQFEKFIGELFVNYIIGNSSESGYKPELKIQFENEEHANVFLRPFSEKYIDYPKQIERLSSHIFKTDPFFILFSDAHYAGIYKQVISIRNFIAHESTESKKKYIQACFGGEEDKFLNPDDYLKSIKKGTAVSYYTFFINALIEMADLLDSPMS